MEEIFILQKIMEDKKLTLDNIRIGDSFKLFGKVCHFVGVIQDEEETIYVYWTWNQHKRKRVYVAVSKWEFEIDLEYLIKRT